MTSGHRDQTRDGIVEFEKHTPLKAGLPSLEPEVAVEGPRIELAEPAASAVKQVPAQPTRVTPVYIPTIASLEDPEPEPPTTLAPMRKWIGKGFFDPFHSFGFKVDWARFARGQVFLVLLGLAMPFVTLLALGALMAVLYSSGAAIASASTPTPFWQIALFPFVFTLAKGIWKAYLLLPLGITLLAWTWALLSAWALSRFHRSALVDFRKAFTTMAMMGAMLAPFATFDFLRLVALGVLLWFSLKRFKETFDVPATEFLRTGGIGLLLAAAAFGGYERWLESFYPDTPSLATELAGLKNGRGLNWPRPRLAPAPKQLPSFMKDLESLDPQVREGGMERAWSFIQTGVETPEVRFNVTHKLAELGHVEAMAATGSAYKSGTGVGKDAAQALGWFLKAWSANPKHFVVRLETGGLMIQTGRRLEGKRILVALAKEQPDQIYKIADFIQKNGLGRSVKELSERVAGAYKGTSNYGWDSSRGRYSDRRYSLEQSILAPYSENGEPSGDLWFYRALLTELTLQEAASASIYGEGESALTGSELEKRGQAGDRNALETLADQALGANDVHRARELWLQATRALDSDTRGGNAGFYLKLAESYDPATAKLGADAKQAVKYYLAVLLVGAGTGQSQPNVVEALRRLGVAPLADPRSQAYVDLTVKHDIPEGWAMLADRYMTGDFPEAPRNLSRARECLLKTESLGYRSPWLYRSLASLDPDNAPLWRGKLGRR